MEYVLPVVVVGIIVAVYLFSKYKQISFTDYKKKYDDL
jgi:hypothetical protein